MFRFLRSHLWEGMDGMDSYRGSTNIGEWLPRPRAMVGGVNFNRTHPEQSEPSKHVRCACIIA